MRISYWSSDVCSSDLGARAMIACRLGLEQFVARRLTLGIELADTLFFLVREPRGNRPRGDEYLRQVPATQRADQQAGNEQNGRASCREREGPYVEISGDGESLKKKTKKKRKNK